MYAAFKGRCHHCGHDHGEPAPAAEHPAVVSDGQLAYAVKVNAGVGGPIAWFIYSDQAGEWVKRNYPGLATISTMMIPMRANEAMNGHPAAVLRELVACVEADSRGPRFEAAMELARALIAGSGGGQ